MQEHLNDLRAGGRPMTREELAQENKRLQNNWNELKKWLEEEIEHNVDGIKSFGGYQCKRTLDKMQELEQGKDENN